MAKDRVSLAQQRFLLRQISCRVVHSPRLRRVLVLHGWPNHGAPGVGPRGLQENVRPRSTNRQRRRADQLNFELRRCIPIGAAL